MEIKIIFTVIRKRIWLVALISILAVCLMGYYSLISYRPQYLAKTTLYVMNTNISRQQAAMQADLEITRVLVNDYREIVKSRLITAAIVDQLGLKGIQPDELARRITVSAKEGTRVIEISAIDTSPEIARDIANKAAEVFAQRAVDLVKVDSVDTVDKALITLEPINSRFDEKLIFAFLSGLVISVLLVLFLEYIDNTIKTREDIEKHLGILVLGTIPTFSIK